MRLLRNTAFGLAALTCAALPALADGMTRRSVKDAPVAADGRKLEWTWNIGATTDYVFRGFSQSAGKPAFQAGADLTYGILYAGVWGSHIDFGSYLDLDGNSRQIGGFAEIDYYFGIKPKWGPVTFDFGLIYYSYPGAIDGNTVLTNKPYEWDYIELKAGASGTVVPNLTTGFTVFYSPEYTNKQGQVWTLEGTAGYELPKFLGATPTLSGTLGYQIGEDFNANNFANLLPTYFAANGASDYLYWNLGLALAFDKLTLDFRYWDTNVKELGPVGLGLGTTEYCKQKVFQCDERFVFSAKLTF
jgi:uncharacterized protein (TIGR02001 family)